MLASARSIVTVEEIVAELDAAARRGGPAVLGGDRGRRRAGRRHPSYAHGYYDRDNGFYRAGTRSAATATVPAWMRGHVLETADVDEYRASLARRPTA